MNKSISIGVMVTAVAVSILTSVGTYWVLKASEPKPPAIGQVMSPRAQNAIDEEDRIIRDAIVARNIIRDTETYNGISKSHGDDVFSQGFANLGGALKKQCEDVGDNLKISLRHSLASMQKALGDS